jgi:hypothetical protein
VVYLLAGDAPSGAIPQATGTHDSVAAIAKGQRLIFDNPVAAD